MKNLVFFLCLVLLTSCASLFGGGKAKITIDNVRPIAEPVTLMVDDKTYHHVEFPKEVKVKRGFKASKITAKANGYEDGEATVSKKFNTVTLCNLILGGIPGFAIDAATGAMMKPSEKYYTLNMQPKNYVEVNPAPVQAAPAPAAPVHQEVVTRDNPGVTAMERTTVRWYFESEPQGARIFWRVISSVPDQVKNTNELWLGNTPFEETRSFNIPGLTYQNANDVQIEIKVRRNGYLDQTKRFNVRQALDQQEISSFFDMVKAEE